MNELLQIPQRELGIARLQRTTRRAIGNTVKPIEEAARGVQEDASYNSLQHYTPDLNVRYIKMPPEAAPLILEDRPHIIVMQLGVVEDSTDPKKESGIYANIYDLKQGQEKLLFATQKGEVKVRFRAQHENMQIFPRPVSTYDGGERTRRRKLGKKAGTMVDGITVVEFLGDSFGQVGYQHIVDLSELREKKAKLQSYEPPEDRHMQVALLARR